MSIHTHSFAHWPFADEVQTFAYCTELVAHRQFPVLYVAHDDDGDWQFLDATTEQPGECVLLCLGCVYERDPDLAAIADLPRGWSAFRDNPGAEWARWENESEPDEREQAALADIERHGLHIIDVAAEGDLPPFSYSIGIERSLGMPELVVIGLPAKAARAAIDECHRQMKSGMPLAPGARVSGLLDSGFDCVIGGVSPEYFEEYMGWAAWLYKGSGFRALQIIFPNPSNIFPWQPEAGEWFRSWQPLFSA